MKLFVSYRSPRNHFQTPRIEPLQSRLMLANTQQLWLDDFNGVALDGSRWELPTATGQNDGTLAGRTRFRSAQSLELPTVSNGLLKLNVDTYNPNAPGQSFYGYQIGTRDSFNVGGGMQFEMGARVVGPAARGVVFSFFLFDETSANHDEIDIQIPTNKIIAKGPDQVLTNLFAQDPSGPGDPLLVDVPGDDLTAFHIFRIEWSRTEINFFVDAEPVRTITTEHIPGPMTLFVNAYAPGSEFTEAYDADLQPTASAGANESTTLEVDYISVASVGADWLVQDGDTLTVNGTESHDVITATVTGDELVVQRNSESASVPLSDFEQLVFEGLGGNDQITLNSPVPSAYVNGGAGDDTILGGDGDDSLTGSAGRDLLNGRDGFDRLDGSKHSDRLFGGEGNDRIYGGDGNDYVDAGGGRDRVYAEDGDDTVLGGNLSDTLYGDDGDDSIDGGNHSDRIFLGAGNDTGLGNSGNDVIDGKDGALDVINGGTGTDGAYSDDIDSLSLVESLLEAPKPGKTG